MMRRFSHKAFTLIEVLVAMAIFAIMSALAYGTLSQTLLSAEILNDRMDRLQALQRTMRLLTDDMYQQTLTSIGEHCRSGLFYY